MITIVNYGSGNISAIINLYKRLNIDTQIANTANELNNATKLIIPGVGAFDHAMEKLQTSGMLESLGKLVLEQKVPVLGICVGMQILAKSSDEGNKLGLGWVNANVKHLYNLDAKASYNLPLPHMGWNKINLVRGSALFENLKPERRFYFLHSYYFNCKEPNDVLATSTYGETFAAVVNFENVFGIQCHPEKSHQNGIMFLKNFAELKL